MKEHGRASQRAESLNEQEYGSRGEQRAESREQRAESRAEHTERGVQSAECSELAAGVAVVAVEIICEEVAV